MTFRVLQLFAPVLFNLSVSLYYISLISLNAPPAGIALIDRSIASYNFSSMCPLIFYDRVVAWRGLEQKKWKNVWCDDKFEDCRTFFIFPNSYDLVRRSVEAASKSRGAATPTHFFAFSLENKSSYHGVFNAQKHKAFSCLLQSHVYVLMRVHTWAAPGGRDRDRKNGRQVLSRKSRYLYCIRNLLQVCQS